MQNRFVLAIGSLLCLSPKCQDRGDLLTNNRKLPESLKQIHNSGQDNSLTGGKNSSEPDFRNPFMILEES